jgi:hypothetical protein
MRNAYSLELFELTNRIASLDWTLPDLKSMHLRLNEIMKAEQSFIVEGAQLQLAA